MGRPREHDDTTAEALLDAAEALLVEGGLSALSVRAVATEAHTTTRAVYALFGSKSGLIEAVAARGYLLVAELANAVPTTDDPRADLIAAGLAFRDFALEHPMLFRLSFERPVSEVSSVDHVGEARRAAFEALLARIEPAQRSRVIDPGIDSAEVAYMFNAVCRGLAGSELLRQPPPVGTGVWEQLEGDDRSESWDRVLRALMDGLAP